MAICDHFKVKLKTNFIQVNWQNLSEFMNQNKFFKFNKIADNNIIGQIKIKGLNILNLTGKYVLIHFVLNFWQMLTTYNRSHQKSRVKFKPRKTSEQKIKPTQQVRKMGNQGLLLNRNSLEQKQDNDKKQKEKQHENFVKMILSHKSSKKQILQLQEIKLNTQIQIHERYLKSKENKTYRFPTMQKLQVHPQSKNMTLTDKSQQIADIKKQKQQQSYRNLTIEPQNVSNQRKRNVYGNKIKTHFQNTIQLSKFNSENQYSFYTHSRIISSQSSQNQKQLISETDQDLEELRNIKLYDLRQQNIGLYATTNFSLSKMMSQAITSKNQQKLMLFRPLSIVESISKKALSLQCKQISSNIKQKKVLISHAKTQAAQHKHESLQNLRIFRLFQRQKQLLAIRSQKKSKAMSFLSPESKQSRIVGSQMIQPIVTSLFHRKTEKSTENNRKKEQIAQNPQNYQNFMTDKDVEHIQCKHTNNTDNFNFIVPKSKSQKILKSTAFLPSIVEFEQKNEQKKHGQNIINFLRNKKLKTLQNERTLNNGIYELIVRKLKTETNTPQNQKSPLKIISSKQSVMHQSDLSQIFSNEKFKNLNSYIQKQKQRILQTKKSSDLLLKSQNVQPDYNLVEKIVQQSSNEKQRDAKLKGNLSRENSQHKKRKQQIKKLDAVISNKISSISKNGVNFPAKSINFEVQGGEKILTRKNIHDDNKFFDKILLKSKLKH